MPGTGWKTEQQVEMGVCITNQTDCLYDSLRTKTLKNLKEMINLDELRPADSCM